jgi:hypothetical protein
MAKKPSQNPARATSTKASAALAGLSRADLDRNLIHNRFLGQLEADEQAEKRREIDGEGVGAEQTFCWLPQPLPWASVDVPPIPITKEAMEIQKTRVFRGVLTYNASVGDSKGSEKTIQIAWQGRDFGMTAAEYFQEHFASTPLADRPFADDVRRASPRFYNALATFQSQRGQSINDLFPADPAARGGAKIKMGPDPTYEELLARRDRERESTRIRVANWRRRKKLEAS